MRPSALIIVLLAPTPACASFAATRRSRAGRSSKRGFSKKPNVPPSLVAEVNDARASTFEAWEQKITAENKAQCAQSHFAIATDGIDVDDEKVAAEWNARAVGGSCVMESRGPVLTAEACTELVGAIEEHAAASGWGSRYSHQSRSLECHVEVLPVPARALFDDALRTTLLPAVAHQLDVPASTVRVYNALAVKYDAAKGLDSMEVHTDSGLATVNIALNAPRDFDGGGTWFQDGGTSHRLERGHALLHGSALAHAGTPISRGVRYIIVAFFISTARLDLCGRLMARGASARAKSDLATAAIALEHATAADGKNAEAWYQRGLLLAQDGKQTEAEGAFERAVALGAAAGGGGVRFDALFRLASLQKAAGRAEQALASFERAVALGPPPGPDSLPAWGVALLTTARYEEARTTFEAALDVNPEDAQSRALLGLLQQAM